MTKGGRRGGKGWRKEMYVEAIESNLSRDREAIAGGVGVGCLKTIRLITAE